MIRRFFSVLICMVFLVTLAYGEETGEEYTLPVKFQKQIALGSGLKGIAQFAVSGSELTAEMLEPLDGAVFNWSYISKEDALQIEVSTEKNGQSGAKTQIYGNGEKIYIGSDLFQGTVYELNLKGDLLTSLLSEKDKNVSLFMPLLKAAQMMGENEALKNRIDILAEKIQTWMDGYAVSPVYGTENDISYVSIRHEIPADALREEMKLLVHEVLNDTELLTALRQNSNEEQKSLYLDRSLEWYYDACIDQIIMEKAAVYEREVTLQGEEIASRLELPLADVLAPWQTFVMEKNNAAITYTLEGEADSVELSVQEYQTSDEGVHLKGTLGRIGSAETDKKAVSLAFDIQSQVTLSTDAEGVQHEYQTWQYTIQNDRDYLEKHPGAEDNYFQLPVIQGTLQLHYYSKPAKRAATTLELSFNTGIAGGKLQGAAKMRTASPWDILPMEPENTVLMSEMDMSERRILLSDLFSNTLLDLHMIDMESQLQAEPIQVEQVVATATDIGE